MNDCSHCGAERPEPSAREYHNDSQFCEHCCRMSPPAKYRISAIIRTLESRIQFLENLLNVSQ